jgi:putative tricarboxylic transport membrane protein
LKIREIANSVFFILLGGLFLFLTRGMEADVYIIGPGFFPGIIAASLIVINLIRLLNLILVAGNNQDQVDVTYKPLYITTTVLVLYLAGCYVIGLSISSVLFLYVMMSLFGNRNRLQKIFISVAVAVAVKVIFKWVLVLPLPTGFWGIF